ncbi:MAG: hypothetical protein J6X03_05405, partial [Bacilli bacterium]|nr:hypothetical protein [Bacilli bacterium]
DQTDDMMEDKIKQKELNRYKRREGWGTRLRGFFLGAAAPLTLLGGGIAGIPLYLASALGLKYVTNQEEKNKSFDNFTKSIVDNGAMNAIGTGLMAIPSIKHARFNNGLEDNLEKVVDKIKKSGIASKSLDLKTGYDKIEELLLTKDDNIIKLIEKAKDAKNLEDVQKIITELTDENIFAVKFIQIMGKDGKTIGDVKIPGDLIQALKKSCPPTRNLEEAQNEINRVYGGAYTVERLCGVGTVAETYAAKDKDGNKVAIKMLKVGINEAKITADKNKFIELIKQNVKDPDKQEYFIKNVEDLYQGIVKEVDLKNELEAANEIAKYTTKADVVKPIACKDNIYVMEYAKGISLKDFSELFRYKTDLEDFEREVRKLEDKLNDLNSQNASADEIEEAENKLLYRKNALTLHKLKMEDEHFKKDYEMFNNLNLTKKDLFYLMKHHNAAITEQFEAHGKDGKCLHADPHDANIMINLDAVKSHKGHAIIFIDTGNTITLNKDQQYAASKLKSVVENANTHALAEIALDGVKLPSNMTKEQAIDKYEAKLKEYLFDPEINLFGEKTGNINEIWGDSNFDTEKFIALTDKILGDMGLVPANTQLNLFKSKKSADTSSAVPVRSRRK